MTDRITLNVGGKLFTTTTGTLLKYKDSTFQKMLNYANWTCHGENQFIDRDPMIFEHILSFLRGYPISAEKEILKKIYDDAIYYNIEPLIETLRVELGIRTPEEEMKYKNECLERIEIFEMVYGMSKCGLNIDSDTEEIEKRLYEIEQKDEEDSIELQSKMFLTWGPYFASIVCPAIEKYFGVNLHGLQIEWDSYLPKVKELIRKYRGKTSMGPLGEIFFKFITDAYLHSSTQPRTSYHIPAIPLTNSLRGLYSF